MKTERMRKGGMGLGAGLLLALLVACGGGGGSPPPPADPGSTDNPPADDQDGGRVGEGGVAYPGFELTLQRGSFWEFGYTYSFSSWGQGSGGAREPTQGCFASFWETRR